MLPSVVTRTATVVVPGVRSSIDSASAALSNRAGPTPENAAQSAATANATSVAASTATRLGRGPGCGGGWSGSPAGGMPGSGRSSDIPTSFDDGQPRPRHMR